MLTHLKFSKQTVLPTVLIHLKVSYQTVLSTVLTHLKVSNQTVLPTVLAHLKFSNQTVLPKMLTLMTLNLPRVLPAETLHKKNPRLPLNVIHQKIRIPPTMPIMILPSVWPILVIPLRILKLQTVLPTMKIIFQTLIQIPAPTK
uniref:Uncharacterized protein n=1 Tax=Cacopsylla melanoneura TaxID=428564 RepID=A0A8D8W7C6_9HEMI